MHIKRINYLGTYLTKEVQNLCIKTTKHQEIKQNLSKLKDMCSWIGWLYIIKMAILPKLFYISNTIFIKIWADFFLRNWLADTKVVSEIQDIHISKNNLEKEEQIWRNAFW